MKATLKLYVTYGEGQDDLDSARDLLDHAAEYLSNNGFITGDTDLEVDEMSHEVHTDLDNTTVMLKHYQGLAMDPEAELIALCKELEKDSKNAKIVRFLDDAINAFATARGCLGHARSRLS